MLGNKNNVPPNNLCVELIKGCKQRSVRHQVKHLWRCTDLNPLQKTRNVDNRWKNLQMSGRANNVKTISRSGLSEVGNREESHRQHRQGSWSIDKINLWTNSSRKKKIKKKVTWSSEWKEEDSSDGEIGDRGWAQTSAPPVWSQEGH